MLRPDHGGTGTFVRNPGSNRFGWTSYLGHILLQARSTVARGFRDRALEALAQHVGRVPARP